MLEQADRLREDEESEGGEWGGKMDITEDSLAKLMGYLSWGSGFATTRG